MEAERASNGSTCSAFTCDEADVAGVDDGAAEPPTNAPIPNDSEDTGYHIALGTSFWMMTMTTASAIVLVAAIM